MLVQGLPSRTRAARETGGAILTLLGAAYVLLLCWQLAAVAESAARSPRDFFQDYVAARQLLVGRTLYPDLAPFRTDLFGDVRSPGLVDLIEVNAHPPLSVLLALPFAALPYEAASWAWELTGLLAFGALWWLILDGTGLRPKTPAGWVAATAAGLSYPAVLDSAIFVTLSPYVSLLLVGTWYAYRRGRPGWAAILLALAIAIKLYPALVAAAFLLRRDWRTPLRVAGWTVALGVLSLPLVGVAAYREYLEVLPRIAWWTLVPGNWSLPGTIGRWVLGGPTATTGVDGQALASVLTVAACASVVALPCLGALARSSGPVGGPRPAFDPLYACMLLVVLLVSPLSWAHYSAPALLAYLLLARTAFGEHGSPALQRTLVLIAFAALALPLIVRVGIALAGISFAEQAAIGIAPNVTLAPLYTGSLAVLLVLLSRRLAESTSPRLERLATGTEQAAW